MIKVEFGVQAPQNICFTERLTSEKTVLIVGVELAALVGVIVEDAARVNVTIGGTGVIR